jgi:hypothetical protein
MDMTATVHGLALPMTAHLMAIDNFLPSGTGTGAETELAYTTLPNQWEKKNPSRSLKVVPKVKRSSGAHTR